MVEVANQEQLKAWLQDRGRDVAIVIGTRIALRTIPLVVDYVRQSQGQQGASFALTIFRALAAPWLAGAWPNLGRQVRDALAAARATAAGRAANNSTAAAVARAAAAASATAAARANTDEGSVAAAREAAVRAAVAAASTMPSVWTEITADVEIIESGLSPDKLIRRPLWIAGTPNEIRQSWTRFKNLLPGKYDNWHVWIEWYEDRLRGEGDPESRPSIETLELRRALIPKEDWEKGPKHLNALIAELETEYRTRPPPQRSAIIEVEYGDDGKLHRRPSRPPEARSEAQAERLRAAWAAHSDQLSALENRNLSNSFPALNRAIKDYRRALSESFDNMNVIALGVHGARLDAFAARADEGLLEDAASELVALAASHGLFIRQFDAWLAYVNDASGSLSAESVDAGIGFARSLPSAEEIIAADVAIPTGELADAAVMPLVASPEDRPPQIVQRELIRSIGNILSGLFTPLVAYARDARLAARKGHLEGITDFTRQATSAIIIAGSSYVLALAANMPAEFGWIIPVLAFLKMKLNK